MNLVSDTHFTKNTDYSREWHLKLISNVNPDAHSFVRVSTFEDDFIADSKFKIEYFTTITIIPEYQDEMIRDFLKRNSEEIENPEIWHVNMRDINRDSIIKRFLRVPLPYFLKLWRTPLIPGYIDVNPFFTPAEPKFSYLDDTLSRIKFSYMNDVFPRDNMSMSFDVYMEWPRLIEDINKHKAYVLQTVMPWIHKHCKGRLYLFSDYESIFENAEDEVTYLADIE